MDQSNPSALRAIAVATFLTLVPITLLVPGLNELVVEMHQGTRFQAHLFVSLNQLAGIVAVPFAMLLHRRFPVTRTWIPLLLLVNAAAFIGMREADSLGELFAWRALDGLMHLPAVTFLMIAANRAGGRRRGASLGVVAAALMVGIGVGAPLGGVLIDRDPSLVYTVGAVLLVVAAIASFAIPMTMGRATTGAAAPATAPAMGRVHSAPASRYQYDRSQVASWMPLAYGFADRFLIGVFVSTFTLFLTEVHGLTAASRGMLMSLFLLPFAALCWPAGKLTDRVGWFRPLVGANILFGLVYASYGVLPLGALPIAMVLSGVLSALMFAPSLVLVSEFARHGAGEGLFGVFQVAGSFGFLAGPLAGGLLVELLRTSDGAPAWAMIFAVVGSLLVMLGLVSWRVLGALARTWGQSTSEFPTVAAYVSRMADTGPRRRGGRMNVPVISPNAAARGNWFMRSLATTLMRAFGWRFSGGPFPDCRKFVMIIAPHTSNWDFAVGLAAMYALGIRGTFLAKHSLFRFPLGILLRWLGGVPVDRTSKSDVVTQTAELIERSDRIIAVLAPEGTRRRTEKWRTGFYWIAHKAGVPILPVVFDYSTKGVHFFPLFTTTGDSERDITELKSLFRPGMARFPGQYSA